MEPENEPTPSREATEILVVCTGNLCRSPFAAAYLAGALQREGIDAVVRSAGTAVRGRARPPTDVVLAAREHGVDLRDHVSRPVTTEGLQRAALVITMTRGHLREVVQRDSAVLSRGVTLVGAVRNVAKNHGVGETVVDRIVGRTTALDLFREIQGEDIPDPMGRSLKVHRSVAAQIAQLVDRLVPSLRGP